MGLVDRFERLLDRIMPPPDEAVRTLRRGEALLAHGDVRAALALAGEAHRVAPGWLAPLVLRADALAADGQPAEALKVLDDAAGGHELPAEVLGRVAALAALVGDLAHALDIERRTRGRVVLDPRGLAARFLQAAERFEAVGEVAASRFARAATVLDPALAPAWILLARAAMAVEDPPRARRLLGRAIASIDPSDAATNHAAGDLAWRLDDRPLAVRCLRRAWVCGEEGAAALLVVALTAADDAAAIERVTRGLDRSLARVVAALGALARGSPVDAAEGVGALEIPDALWPYGIELAVRSDFPLAVRWATEAPARPVSPEVLALAAANASLARAEVTGVVETLALPLSSLVTRSRAAEALARSFELKWGPSVDSLLAGLAGWLRANAPAESALAGSLDALRRSLDEPLRVAILGEFSAGKSTVVNAWVGAALSAVGVLPTTARVYWLRQGEARARVLDAHGGLREGPIGALPEALRTVETEGRAVAHVELFYPSAALAHLELLDTPGSNASDGIDPAVTRHALELADLALWIFDARQAGKQSEIEALRAVRTAGVPVLGAINKADVVGAAGVVEVEQMLRDTLGDEAPILGAFGARGVMAGVEGPGWEDFKSSVGRRVIARRDGWKRLRVAERLRVVLTEVQRARREEAGREATRRGVEAQLVDALGGLRDEVTRRAAQVRREVAASLKEQWPSLRGKETAPAEDVLRDVVAELVHQCVQRERTAMAERRGEVEALAVAAGAVRPGLGVVFSAPVDGLIRAAVSEGVRDALDQALRPSVLGQAAEVTSQGLDIGDPWREVSAALDAMRSPADLPTVMLGVALDAAVGCARRAAEALAPTLGVKVTDANPEPRD